MSELNRNMLVMFGWKNEQFEDTKGVIRSPNSQKDRQLSNRKKTNSHLQTPHRKLSSEQHERH